MEKGEGDEVIGGAINGAHIVQGAIGLAGIIEGKDGWMAQVGRGRDFPQKPARSLGRTHGG